MSVSNAVHKGFEGELYLSQESVVFVVMDYAEVFAKGGGIFGGFDRAESVFKEALV